MTQSNILPFPANAPKRTGTAPDSVWVLFVLEDLRQHFQGIKNPDAVDAIECAIQKLEPAVMCGTP